MNDAEHNALRLEFKNAVIRSRQPGSPNVDLKKHYGARGLSEAEMDQIIAEALGQN